MAKAARAIIIEDGKLLVMFRSKNGAEYYTLVGGRADGDEQIVHTLVREVMEETGLQITAARLVFIEEHPAPYNEQYIFLCEVAPHSPVAIQDSSEEGYMNKLTINLHRPEWTDAKRLSHLSFRTPQLQSAIVEALKKGFPDEPVRL